MGREGRLPEGLQQGQQLEWLELEEESRGPLDPRVPKASLLDWCTAVAFRVGMAFQKTDNFYSNFLKVVLLGFLEWHIDLAITLNSVVKYPTVFSLAIFSSPIPQTHQFAITHNHCY